MNLQRLTKHKALLVASIITIVLLVAGGVMLLRMVGRFDSIKKELETTEQRLNQINERDPYPSQENIKVVKQNRETMMTFLYGLQEELMKNQIEPLDMESAAFTTLLEASFLELTTQATNNNVKLNEKFGYGVTRYVQGDLPKPADLPRLTVQMQMIKNLCEILFDEGIDSLDSIERDMFEDRSGEAAAASGGRGGETAAGEDGELFTSERIAIEFTSSDAALWRVLDRLVQTNKMFAVVKKVEITNKLKPSAMALPKTGSSSGRGGGQINFAELFSKGSGAEKPKTREEAEAFSMKNVSHDDRVLAGEEPIEVLLVLDVYRFKHSAANKEEEGKTDGG